MAWRESHCEAGRGRIVYARMVALVQKEFQIVIGYYQRQPHGICPARSDDLTSIGLSGGIANVFPTASSPVTVRVVAGMSMTARTPGNWRNFRDESEQSILLLPLRLCRRIGIGWVCPA